jgi:hypothetical protein
VLQAAYEVEPASYAMALRTFKTETLTGEQAMLRLRGGINDEIKVQRQLMMTGAGAAGSSGLLECTLLQLQVHRMLLCC